MPSALLRDSLVFKPPVIWNRSTVLLFLSATDTADYTFKLHLIMNIALINQNMKAEVVFCGKAYHFTILKAGASE